MVPLIVWRGHIGDVRTQLSLNTLRVLLSSTAITINFFAISQIQLAQLSTIGYLRPAVTSMIAYIFLRETQAWHRWLVILIGFAAIFFIFSPEDSQLQLVAVFAFFGMCFGSSATILQKFLSREMIESLEKYLAKTDINYRIEWYPGTEHGFVFPDRKEKYNRTSAERHWYRILNLFERNLK